MIPVHPPKEKYELKPKRAILPQFDFGELPSIPSKESYKYRKRYINNKVESVNKSCRTKLTTLPVIRNHNRTTSQTYEESYSINHQRSSRSSSTLDVHSSCDVLDRAKILECGHSDSPEQVLEVMAEEKNLGLVDILCLYEFTRLYYMNLTGNCVEMEQLAGLPVLKELVLNCNSLRGIRVPVDGFACLEKLDLSYNTFDDPYLFDQLANLKRLRILNLSSNNFGHLPRHLGGLKTLEELILESNTLQENVFESLNTIPSLKRVNLNHNFVERIPVLTVLDSLANLEYLSLGNNKLMYYDDIYALKEYKALKKLELWGNPIVNRKKEIENVFVEIGRPGLIILVDGPIPLQSKYLGVSKFYTEKFRTVEHYNPFKELKITTTQNHQKERKVIDDIEGAIEDDQDEEHDTGSFFLTETKHLDYEEAVPSPISPVNIGYKSSKFRRNPLDRIVNNMYSSKVTTSVKKPMDDLISSVELTDDVESSDGNESNAPSEADMNGMTIFDYNSDWFKLDAALEALGESLRSDPVAPTVPGTMYRNDFKSKKKMFSALKFALQNPLSAPLVNKVPVTGSGNDQISNQQ